MEKRLLGYAHASAIEDLFYIFHDQELIVTSYKPHYVKVELMADSDFWIRLMYQKAQAYLYFDEEDCYEAYVKDPLT